MRYPQSELERVSTDGVSTKYQQMSDVDTVNTKAKQYQECETLITRIEVRIMRLRREKVGVEQEKKTFFPIRVFT